MSEGQTVEQEARAMGWAPKEEFRGDESRWVDAETFVERGHTVMPLLKKQKEELQNEVVSLRTETQRLQQLFAASQESIQALQNFHSENTKRQVKAARDNLLAELKQAKKDGDTDLEVDLMAELTQANAAVDEAEKAKLAAAAARPADQSAIDPAYTAFVGRNKWYGVDVRKTNLAYSIATAMRADPDNDTLIGDHFYAAIEAELNHRANGGSSSAKVGSGSSSSSGGGSSSGKGYESLDAEAKKICNADEKKFVGEGRMFKTVADYRKFYASQVFGE